MGEKMNQEATPLLTVAQATESGGKHKELVIRGIRLAGKALVVNLLAPNEELLVDRDIHVAPLFNSDSRSVILLSEAKPGQLPLDRIWRSLCTAMDYVHQQGYLHGRLTPEKVLWDQDHERILITGWERPFMPPTELELRYSPPEVLDRNELTQQTDSYYLASMLYTLLTGQTVHAAEGGYLLKDEVLRNELNPALVAGKRMEKELSVVLARALSRTPAERFESVLELGNAFYSNLYRLVEDDDDWVSILLYTWMSMSVISGLFSWTLAYIYG